MLSATITQPNQFTDGFIAHGVNGGTFLLSGTFVATITLQIYSVLRSEWIDVQTWTGPGLYKLIPSGFRHRIGVKSGGYTSGIVYVEIVQETM